MSNRSERRWIAGVCATALSCAAALGVARGSEKLDPTVPQRWVVGAPKGAAPMNRLDPERTGRAGDALPRAPRVAWRARIQGGIAHPVAVDESGAVIVSSSIATLSQVSADGKPAWTARTGSSPAVTSPVLLSDGTRTVLTQNGELLGFDRSGKPRFSVPLPVGPASVVADPLPQADGGLVIASGRNVMRLDRAGGLIARTRMDSSVRSLVQDGTRTLLVGERGDVHEWRPPAEPSRVGSFGGAVSDALRAGANLLSIVDGKKLVELELKSGTRRERAEIPNGSSSSPTLLANGSTRLVTLDGMLLGHDANGEETARVALEPPSLIGDAGVPLSASIGPASPPPIADRAGRIGFVRPGLDAGVVDKSGAIAAADGAACLDPVGVAPAGRGRMVLACRSGVLFLLSDTKP